MKHIIIALDSFKGCLSSSAACLAAAQGVRHADSNTTIEIIPLSDGGEGLTEVLTHALGGHLVTLEVHGPLMDPLQASYGIIEGMDSNGGPTGVIEMAAACGLPLVALHQRNPLNTTTYGFGEMILDALHRGCSRLILGIGGSATNDAGLGMLQALGAEIELKGHLGKSIILPQNPSDVQEVLTGSKLSDVNHIDTHRLSLLFNNVDIQVACDVQNPLCGQQGAAFVFAPQKGADIDAVKRLDIGLAHILDITQKETLPGDGAAGGLGFALRHFLGAKMSPGIELVLTQLHFDEHLEGADIIITGEGKSDAQTLMGKVPMGVLQHASRFGKPVYLIAGKIEDSSLLLKSGFNGIHCINDGDNAPLSELMDPEHASRNICNTLTQLIHSLQDGILQSNQRP